jgi:hypothetical protein
VRVVLDGLYFLQVYFPFVDDQSVVEFSLIVGSEEPVASCPEFVLLSEDYVVDAFDDVVLSYH